MLAVRVCKTHKIAGGIMPFLPAIKNKKVFINVLKLSLSCGEIAQIILDCAYKEVPLHNILKNVQWILYKVLILF